MASLGSSLWIGGEVSYYPILWLSLKSVSKVTQHHRFAKMTASLGSSLWIGGEVSYYPILWLVWDLLYG